MNKIFRLPSKLFFDLWTRGNETHGLTGTKLIAVYSILKCSRENEVKYYSYKSKNNKIISGYALLRAKTNLSLHTIEKYVPVLCDMGLCFIDSNGDFVLLGNQKVKELYSSYDKIIPIKIGKNLTDTAHNVLSVISHAKERQQQKQYKKKLTRSENQKQGAYPRNNNAGKSAFKRSGEVFKLNEKTVLSVKGFAALVHGKENNIKNLKSSGCYWKRILKSKGIVKTKRQFENIQKMSHGQYLQLKNLGLLDYNQTYKGGYLVAETISTFSAIDLTKKETVFEVTVKKEISEKKQEYKKKPYLEFDMIDFWINR